MRRLSIIIFVALVTLTNGFQMPLNRIVLSKKTAIQKMKVHPQFAVDYNKNSLLSSPISLDKSPFPPKSNHGSLLLIAALSVILFQNFHALTQGLLKLPSLLPSRLHENFLQRWSQSILKRFGRARLASNWNKCVLQSKTMMNDKFVKYRFSADPNFLSSSMSQVQLCSGNSKDDAKVETFCCLNYSSEGYFEIIDEESSNNSGSNILSSLSSGDEVAFTAKDFQLKLSNSQKSFFFLTIGLGIIPTLQVINQILSQSEAEVYIMWTNSNRNDFIFNDFVKAMESLYPQRLTVSRIIDDSVDNSRSNNFSERIKRNIPPFELGKVGAVFVPSREVNKAKSLMNSVNYPDDSVLICDA